MGYSVKEEMLFYKDKIVIPDMRQWKETILNMFHESLIGGHGGTQKTYKAIAENFYWKNMRDEVKEFFKGCVVCQQIKYPTNKKQGLPQPLPVPGKPWEDLTMDFITGLPSSKGCVAILVVVDRSTKGAHFSSLRPAFTAT